MQTHPVLGANMCLQSAIVLTVVSRRGMLKSVTACFSDDMTLLSDEIKNGNRITGYFLLTALENKDGQPYYIANSNYDSAPGELLGNIELEKIQLSLRIHDQLQKEASSTDLKLIPDPINTKRH